MRMRWERYVERMDEIRNAYKCLVGNPEENRAVG
jgi:hypothetical protein